MSDLPFMPLYIGDWLKDTGHLNATEERGYLRLVMHYWCNGGLPTDDRHLAAIAKIPLQHWSARYRDPLSKFFTDGWRHKRIDHELKIANLLHIQRVEAGRAGSIARAKRKHSSSAAQADHNHINKERKDGRANGSEASGKAVRNVQVGDRVGDYYWTGSIWQEAPEGLE